MQIVSDPDALQRLADAWWDLLTRSDADNVTLSPAWLLPWWRIFGDAGTRRLCVCLFWDGTTLVGLAPLLRRWRFAAPALPFARIELLGTGEPEEDEIVSEYVGVIAARGQESIVAEALARVLVGHAEVGVAARPADSPIGRWDEISLSAMDGGSPLPAYLRTALEDRGLAVELTTTSVAPHIPLPESFNAYLAALSSSNRYFARRSLREFDAYAGGKARFHRAEEKADLPRATEVLISLHAQRWRAAGRLGAFASRRFEAFHRAVMPALLSRGALELRWVTVADRPVAALYNLVSRGRVQSYQGGRSLDAPAAARVGIALHLHAIRAAIADGRREYDFLGGRSQYKRQLALAERPLTRLVVERPGARRLAHSLTRRGFRWLRERYEGAPAESPRSAHHSQ
ncbi:MAG TPA: GNAT family N-acetyltransferase [Polyangia bacterium]|nr:GNAT family N-acetyltransferase [Polyangia bacterium]